MDIHSKIKKKKNNIYGLKFLKRGGNSFLAKSFCLSEHLPVRAIGKRAYFQTLIFFFDDNTQAFKNFKYSF